MGHVLIVLDHHHGFILGLDHGQRSRGLIFRTDRYGKDEAVDLGIVVHCKRAAYEGSELPAGGKPEAGSVHIGGGIVFIAVEGLED